jgi:hypothetical protein
MDFGTQAAKQHMVGDQVFRVPLEARALEPLHQEGLAFQRHRHWLGQRQAKQRQIFGGTLALFAIEVQAVGALVAQETRPADLVADIVPRFGEVAAAGM